MSYIRPSSDVRSQILGLEYINLTSSGYNTAVPNNRLNRPNRTRRGRDIPDSELSPNLQVLTVHYASVDTLSD
jgi:hypothetical protein